MTRLPARAIAVALSLLILAAGLAACGSKSDDTKGEPEKLTLDLDFYPNPDHAGIYMAQEEGFFKEAGLEVAIDSPSDPAAPLKDVAAGRADLAITYEPEVTLAHEQGLDVVAVAALVNQPLTSLIWLKKSGIKGVADLQGKTVSYAGIPYQEAFLKTILARAKVPASTVKTANVGFGLIPSLVSGSAQAMLGGYSNVEGVDLRERGKQPVITPVDQLGVPTYDELVFVARRSTLEEDGQKIRLFISALQARHRSGGEIAESGQRSDPRRQPRPRTETGRSRDRGDAAAARRPHRRAALRLHGPEGVGSVRRLDARRRTDLRRCRKRPNC